VGAGDLIKALYLSEYAMRINCPSCHSTYHIPDKRIPVGKEIVFPCPACKKGLLKANLKSKSFKERSVQARELPRGKELKKKILRSTYNLPAMPQIVPKAREIIADPVSSIKDLVRLIESDQSIAARALKLANSAYYGLSGKVSSIQHACVLLGYKSLGELITIAATSTLMGGTLKGYEADSGDLWRHSLAVAIGSTIIAEKQHPGLVNDALVAGLLHDAGKIILDPYILERKEAFEAFLSDGLKTFLHAEKEILGFDHSAIASDICKIWRLPQAISTAIKYHHKPSASHKDELSYVCHMADVIAMMVDLGTGVDDVLYQMDEGVMEFLALREEDVSRIMNKVADRTKKITQDVL